MAAVALELEPGWKTYWRAPGDAGIPPQFDWKGSRNLHAVSVSWPTPKVFDQNGMRSIGYDGKVVLPIAMTPRSGGRDIDVDLTMDIGVCHDICIPERIKLKGTLSAAGTTPVPAIAAALAERPYTASEAGAGAVTCRIEPIKDGLSISADLQVPYAGGSEVVVIEAGRPDLWVSEATTQRSGNTLSAQADIVPSGNGTLALDRSAIRFTVLGASHAVDMRGCTPG
ncbi:hypothetical protein K3756_03525 [Sulfitobacter sp. S190]|nr:hypothetical protein K3756_03525 [Sulfitobacter sp. S190]